MSKLKIPKISENSQPFKIPETFHGKFPKFPETFRPFASLHTLLGLETDFAKPHTHTLAELVSGSESDVS